MISREPHPVSIHTVTGRRIGDLPPVALSSLTWGRESSEVSRCELATSYRADEDLVSELIPWLHWVTVWDEQLPVWTGPIQRVVVGATGAQITCRDVSTFMWRTRTPLTKKWDNTDPARIAAELWIPMLELHRVKVDVLIRENPAGDLFNFTSTADTRMMHQTIDDLTKLGLEWRVVAGRPVFGPMPTDPIDTFTEADLMGEIQTMRDGTGTFNDVRLQGKNYTETTVADLGGLRLQTLVSMDDLFGVSNIQKASQQYTRQVSTVRNSLVMPSSVSLHPDAPVSLNDLNPGTCFRVDARGVSNVMRVESMQVSQSPGRYDVQVGLATLDAPTELGAIAGTPTSL